MECWISTELREECSLVDVIETTFDIGVQNILVLFADGCEDCSDRIMT